MSRNIRMWSKAEDGSMTMTSDITIEDIDISADDELGSVYAFFWRCACGEMGRQGFVADWKLALASGREHACETEAEDDQEQPDGQPKQGTT